MYRSISDFIKEWNKEALLTQNVLDTLTDDALKQQVYGKGRTLGRIAWHVITNIPDYLTHFGLMMDRRENEESVPASAQEIAAAFKDISSHAARIIEQQWTDESLEQMQTAFGRQESNAEILMGLIKHIVHHRGQMTVLMRQAGIKPPGVYGPPKEDWIHLGVKNPPL
ncbi:DinB family protein [Peribacillus muralis]|uniref:DinB family protein n=1 Tax=Peribacillus muralis TaxID=264697 RepID=UPI00070BFDFC|nr:DinB family protein [Peribacillus muralis]